MTTPTVPAKKPARFHYFCPVCCSSFVGDAARRHAQFMRAQVRREDTERPAERVQRIA